MMSSERVTALRTRLEASKTRLLEDIQACDNRIQELRASQMQAFVRDDSSSDSEHECKPYANLVDLRLECGALSTRLDGSKELMKVNVLSSQVRVLREIPEELAKSVPAGGMWREVFMNCHLVLLTFDIGFLVHKPNGNAPQSYHAIKVKVHKEQKAKELSQSVLDECQTPSEVIQLLTSYAKAHNDRRFMIRELYEKYAEDEIDVNINEDKVVIVTCVDIMKMEWHLRNKSSPLQPFTHFMRFDFDYMEEDYVKNIKKAHLQLRDPDISITERLHLLSRIIDTCLDVNRQTLRTAQSTELDIETAKHLSQRRMTFEHNPDHEEELRQDDFNRSVVKNFGSKPKRVEKLPERIDKKVVKEVKGVNICDMLEKSTNKENIKQKKRHMMPVRNVQTQAKKIKNVKDMGPPLSPIKNSDKPKSGMIKNAKGGNGLEKVQSIPSSVNMGPPLSPIKKVSKTKSLGEGTEKQKGLNKTNQPKKVKSAKDINIINVDKPKSGTIKNVKGGNRLEKVKSGPSSLNMGPPMSPIKKISKTKSLGEGVEKQKGSNKANQKPVQEEIKSVQNKTNSYADAHKRSAPLKLEQKQKQKHVKEVMKLVQDKTNFDADANKRSAQPKLDQEKP